MEITRHNFHEELDNIIAAINDCSFLAIDGEFTGLDSGDCGHAAPFDTPVERYNKLRNGASDFLLIQFGLCTFTANENEEKYVARPYNFYVFPRPFNRAAPDRRFLCQSSSIDFLVAQGFDFNKLFKEGIPYLTPEQETKLKTELDRKHEETSKLSLPDSTNANGGGSAKKTMVPVPEDQKVFLNNICEKISQYLEGDDSEPLIIPPCNAFQRKLIYQTVEEKFPLAHLETKTGEKKERFMVVSRTKDTEERLKREQDKIALEKMELDMEVGFSKVIRAITNSGKLVVGHNMFLDVVHVVNQFHSSLPAELDGFKLMVSSVFPRLLDTKLMANTQPIQEHVRYSALDELRSALRGPPFVTAKVVIADGFSRYDGGGGAFHEAGYDALITGSCFTTMVNYLGKLQNSSAFFTLPSSHLVEPFINKLFLMRIADIPYLNLTGPDLEVSREHVFHVTFPKEWRQSDLHSLFQPYGNIQVSWLSDTSCYVALYKKDNAKSAIKALSQSTGPYHVVSYAFHHRSKNLKWTAATPMPSPTTPVNKRKLLHPDSDVPPLKVKRHSLPNECPPIPEEDESSENEKLKDLQDGVIDSSCTPKKKEAVKDKIFDESDAW
ncbi:hypothetical protein Btru_059193 [Bulinus truncatus]|nr:hypothetical protein Btru_059193 [Bulinus truncatus]